MNNMKRTSNREIYNAMENEGFEGWRKKVFLSRPISALLKAELLHVDLLYERLQTLRPASMSLRDRMKKHFLFRLGKLAHLILIKTMG